MCIICRRPCRDEYIPEWTSRGGVEVICDQCVKSSSRSSPSDSVSVKSTSSALVNEGLAQPKVNLKNNIEDIRVIRERMLELELEEINLKEEEIMLRDVLEDELMGNGLKYDRTSVGVNTEMDNENLRLGVEERIRSFIMDGNVQLDNYRSRNQTQIVNRIGVGVIPDLPEITGQSKSGWIEFVTALFEDTEIFGLSHQENIRRVKKSLRGKWSGLFQGWLAFSEQLPDILKILHRIIGSPQRLLGQAEDALRDIPSLRTDLSNLAVFSGH